MQSENRWTVGWPSQDPRLVVTLSGVSSDGTLALAVERDGRPLFEIARLGLRTEAAVLTQGLRVTGRQDRNVTESYRTTVGKRLERHNEMTEAAFSLVGPTGEPLELVVRVARDGVAYRFILPQTGSVKVLSEEATFRFPPGHTTWMQEYTVNYEAVYSKVPGEQVKPGDYAYPALYQVGEVFVLLTETDLDGRYCGSRLVYEGEPGTYSLQLADPTVESRGPLATPWRVAVIGDLATVAESTLPDDLAPPSKIDDTSWIRPGRVAWSWLAGFGRAQSDFATQQRFVDYAAAHGWEYVLVDDGWRGQDWVPALVRYAKARGVDVMLWMHWEELSTEALRKQVLDQVVEWGVVGLKIDFMDSDSQARYRWYDAVLHETAARKILVNFHGSTIPHGIHRTWPHVMTMEAVRGNEHTNLPAEHIVTLPLTRNVLGSMDYTPMSFQFGVRNLSDAAELALSLLFESGLQNYAGSIEVYMERPELERFLEQVPAVWDETRWVGGMPGESAVMARRNGERWFIGGVFTGDGGEREIPCHFLAGRWLVEVVRDGDGGLVRERHVINAPDEGFTVHVGPNGGFAAIACPERAGRESCDLPIVRKPLVSLEAALSETTVDPGAEVELTADFRVEQFGPVRDVRIMAVCGDHPLEGEAAEAGELATDEQVTGRWRLRAPDVSEGKVLVFRVRASYRPADDDESEPLQVERVVHLVVRPVGIHFVSDLPFVASTNGWGPVERDMANGGNQQGDGPPLRLRGTTYYKGLGMHAPAEVVIATDGKYDRFTAWVGIDDSRAVRRAGSVQFEVEGDGKLLVKTDVFTFEDPAHRIDVNIKGVQQLTLRVNDGGDGKGNDHANWADARLHLKK